MKKVVKGIIIGTLVAGGLACFDYFNHHYTVKNCYVANKGYYAVRVYTESDIIIIPIEDCPDNIQQGDLVNFKFYDNRTTHYKKDDKIVKATVITNIRDIVKTINSFEKGAK